MKKSALIGFALTVAAGAYAADDKAFLAILAETKVSRVAGLPMMKMPKIPGLKLPASAMGMMSGEPTRTLNVRLWSPSLAPDDAFAFLAPPSGLKQGDKLNLDLFRPQPAATATTVTASANDPETDPEFTIKLYWGSSEAVKPDQPKVIHWGGLTPEQKEAVKARSREARRAGQSYFFKPNWTTGYWPTTKEPGQIDADASLVGNFALTSNYTGNVAIEAPKEVDFLSPLEMTAPSLEDKIDFSAPIAFQWNAVPNLLGQNATIFGMEGKSTMIIWTSSEVPREGAMADTGYLQMSEVRDLVNQTVFMAGDRTNVTVPAGIFKDADFSMFTMAGYGPGVALGNVQPLPRIQTKTTLTIMLGGKMEMGGGKRRHH